MEKEIKRKNILMLTSEYSCNVRTNERWTKIVSYFTQEWAKNNNVIVIINSTRFPRFYYHFGALLRGVVARLYHKDPKYITDETWNKDFDFTDGWVRVFNRPLLKYYPHARHSKRQLTSQTKKIKTILDDNSFIPDIICGHWPSPQLGLILNLKKDYIGARTALVLHGGVTGDVSMDEKFGAKLNQLDKVGCRNQTMANFLYEKLRLSDVPFVCPSGLPDEFAQNVPADKFPFSEEKISIVSVCRLLDWKCIDDAVRGIEIAFGGCNYKYDIIGEGPWHDTISSVIKELDICEKVSLVGRLTRDEVQKKLVDADAFVLISKHETFGLVYLEAMIQGCITIGSKRGGIDGIIVDGENGFLCEEGDADDLAKVLEKIQRLSPKERKKISDNAIATALEYTDSKVAQRYLENISK